MQNTGVVTGFDGMPYATIKEIRDQASKKLNYLKSKMQITANLYVPVKKYDDFKIAKDWAIRNRLVNRTSDWSFLEFCMLNTLDLIARQAKAERAAELFIESKSPDPEPTQKPQDEQGGTNTQTHQE